MTHILNAGLTQEVIPLLLWLTVDGETRRLAAAHSAPFAPRTLIAWHRPTWRTRQDSNLRPAD